MPAFSFEVKESDLMGRVGLMRVGGKTVETPCLTPVVHPVWRDIKLSQFKEMGFEMLMTNSYILYRRARAEALEKGLHALVDFDGALMTDSGGYQVLEYGDADVTPEEIASFQAGIGSDLAVTLDQPTGYSNSRKYAKHTMQASLSAAKATLERHGDSETVWVGPIQGGVFGDLVRSSARSLVEAGFQVLALGSPVELMEGYMFTPLVEMIANARRSTPYSRPLHLFGAGHPLTLALSVALGCDTFDSASYMLYARKDRYMTERGTLSLDRMTYLPCSCPVCNAATLSALRESPRQERVHKVALHNLHVLRAEVLRCREAIYEGRLWDLAEERAMAHPRSALAFRALASGLSGWLAKPTPLLKARGLAVRSEEDRNRPELILARGHLEGAMRRRKKGSKTAVLVMSDAAPPLTKTSGNLRSTRGAKGADLFRVNPVLGPFPAELEFVYPFSQTVADGESEEATVKACVKRLKGMGYSRVIVAKARPKDARR